MAYHQKYIKYKQKYVDLRESMQDNFDLLNDNNVSKEIYLIRHGETDWNKMGLPQGSRNDTELNKNGKLQASQTGQYLLTKMQDRPFNLIMTSPMKRAHETASIIAHNIGYNKKDIVIKDYLTEVDSGLIAIGKPISELEHDSFYDDYFNEINEYDKLDHISDKLSMKELSNILIKKYEMESHHSICRKVNKLINFLRKTQFNKIIIVSHSVTIDWINRVLLNTYDTIKGNMDNGSNCHLTFYQMNNDGKFKLIVAPNTLHLK